jgi:hypothetical protein
MDVEIETITIMTTMVGADDEEILGCCPFEEEPPVSSPRMISRRRR